MATLSQTARKRRRPVLRQFTFLFLLSLALLVSRDATPVRAAAEALTQLLAPAESALTASGSAVGSFLAAIGEIERLRADNARLRDEVDRLTLENVRLREQAIQAQQAAKLDQAARALEGLQTLRAPVIARDPSGIVRTVLIGLGSQAGVALGNPVVSDQGLVGRVSEVGPTYAKVLLVTDSASAVSAIVQGSRATGIVRGQYGDTLVMDWILQTESVAVGDVVITAGLALGNELRSFYPKGLVIGRVVDVGKGENGAYQRAVILPAVDLRTLEQVLVVRTQ